MTFSRATIGAIVGIVIALVWKTLGSEVVLWIVIFGAVGAVVGYFLDHPGKLIEYLKRLER